MDFSWSEEELQLRQKVVDFAQQELNEDLVNRDQHGIFSRKVWCRCAEFGIQGFATPGQYGGRNEQIDFLSAILAMEGLGYGCRDNGLAFGLNAQMWTVQLPIVQFGTEDQKQKFLPRLTNGQWIGAHAITEQDAGSDVFNMKTTAEKSGDGYILNGQKCLVTFAPVADFALVFANARPESGKWGVTAFLVEKGAPGFSVSPVYHKMGLRTVPIGDIILENCWVPDENRLGAEGAGFSLSNHSLEYERCSILASQLGSMEHQVERTIEFAQNRQQSGRPIGQYQSVANRIVEMKLRLETSRLLLYKAAWLKSKGKSAMLEAALLKLHLSESFVSSSLDSIRTHGGMGYLSDNEIERDMRDSIGGLLYAGTSDIQRNIIARLMGL